MKTLGFHATRRRAAQGFSLIEVLLAIVILAFGMLGTVGMQAYALQANRDARTQAQAVSLARELAEMMRGNPLVAAKTTVADNPYLVDSMTPASASYCLSVGNSATGCASTTDVANAEITDWLARVAAELPGARVSVCFDADPYDGDGLPKWACAAAVTGVSTGGSGAPAAAPAPPAAPAAPASAPAPTAAVANGVVFIKIGWTRASTDKSKTGAAALEKADATGSRPQVIFPVSSGSTAS